MPMSAFEGLGELAPVPVWGGVIARAVHGERVTLGVIEFEPDSDVPEHAHANEQLGLLLSGSLTLRVGEESRTVAPGELWRIPANVPHAGRAGPQGAVVVVVFGPPREDWRALEPLEPRPPHWP
jgi:quercetin dioxygenase-like cupin family protein